MSVHFYQGLETIEAGNLYARILRTLSSKSFVVEIWRTTGRCNRLDARRTRSRDAAKKTADRLLNFWAENPSAASSGGRSAS